MNELLFVLDVKDGWPPVAVECLPCKPLADGFLIEEAPLFIKNLSAGDIISAKFDDERRVISWEHLKESGRSTIWLLRLAKTDSIMDVLEDLRALGCNTVRLPQFGCYSIDVPEECAIADVDACLAKLNHAEVAVAFPSFRHEE